MKIRYCEADSFWYCEIVLNKRAWPDLDPKGEWMHRPIRQWVYNNTSGDCFFAGEGWVLFEKQSDAIAFQLTWG